MTIVKIKHFSLDEYHRLTEMGFFTEDDRVELIRGQIVEMAAKGRAHEVCITRLIRELTTLLPSDRAILRCQSPITLDTSEPEPDFSIAQFREDDYLASHPSAAEVLLVIEISDSSLAYDQEIKLPLYSEATITNYWIFNLTNNYLECYSEPYQNEGKFGYRVKKIMLPNEAIDLPGFPDVRLDLSRIFPIQTL